MAPSSALSLDLWSVQSARIQLTCTQNLVCCYACTYTLVTCTCLSHTYLVGSSVYTHGTSWPGSSRQECTYCRLHSTGTVGQEAGWFHSPDRLFLAVTTLDWVHCTYTAQHTRMVHGVCSHVAVACMTLSHMYTCVVWS